MNLKSSISFATALASLLSACGASQTKDPSVPPTSQLTQEVKCEGINSCKGTSECASKDGNSCQGLNECKGQGWVTESSRESCETKGGKVIG